MHLGIYEFNGDPEQLLPAYDRLMAAMPSGNTAWHLCVVREGGITIYDTCRNEAVFQSFSTDAGFREAIAGAGLPEPRITGLPVHAARAPQSGPG
jgi:hypothetical protein